MAYKDLYIPVKLPWENNLDSHYDQEGLKPTKLTSYVMQLEHKYGTVNHIPKNSKDYNKLMWLADQVTWESKR